jgi:hypothetical protein
MQWLYPDTFTAACPLLKNSLIYIVLLNELTPVGYAICFTVINCLLEDKKGIKY